MEQKIEKNFLVFQILAFELEVANSGNIEQDTTHRESMCKQTPLRFRLTLGETFSKWTFPKMMKKYGKIALMEISELFGTLSLPMASILFSITRICNSQLKCNYLKNKKHFLNFLFHCRNLHEILNILEKRWWS